MDDLNEKIKRVFADLGIRCAYNMPSFWANDGKDYKVIPTRYAKGYQKALEDAEREILEVLSEQPEQSSEIQDILEYLDTVLHPIISPDHWNVYSELHDMISMLPSTQPEITDGQAIEHLQSTGWMQNHDKQMYEMGLKEQLADDSGGYDSLIPSAQPEHLVKESGNLVKGLVNDCISREDAIDVLAYFDEKDPLGHTPQQIIMALPSVQPQISGNAVNLCETCKYDFPECPKDSNVIFGDGKGNDNVCACSAYEVYVPPISKREWYQKGYEAGLKSVQPQRWIPVSEALPEEKQDVLLAFKHNMVVGFWEDILNDGGQAWYANSGNGWFTGTEAVDDDGFPLAWMPLPEPYAERKEDE